MKTRVCYGAALLCLSSLGLFAGCNGDDSSQSAPPPASAVKAMPEPKDSKTNSSTNKTSNAAQDTTQNPGLMKK